MKRTAMMLVVIASTGLLAACDEGKTSTGYEKNARIDGVAPPALMPPDLSILDDQTKIAGGGLTSSAPTPLAPVPATAPATEPSTAPESPPEGKTPPTPPPATEPPPVDTPVPPAVDPAAPSI